MPSPPYILLLYEDAKFIEFDRLIRRLRSQRFEGGVVLEKFSARGTGGFLKDLPRLLRDGLPKRPTPPAFIVAVADADRPTNLVKDFEGDISCVRDFVRLQRCWQQRLRETVGDEDHRRVFSQIVRWSQETVYTLVPDLLLRWAGPQRASIEQHFAECDPDPRMLEDGAFIDSYRNPQRCIRDVVRLIWDQPFNKANHGARLMRKVLDDQPSIDTVLERWPELRRLSALLNRLSSRLEMQLAAAGN